MVFFALPIVWIFHSFSMLFINPPFLHERDTLDSVNGARDDFDRFRDEFLFQWNALLRNIKKDKKAGRSEPGDREDEVDEKED